MAQQSVKSGLIAQSDRQTYEGDQGNLACSFELAQGPKSDSATFAKAGLCQFFFKPALARPRGQLRCDISRGGKLY